jgi:hypothetical protein
MRADLATGRPPWAPWQRKTSHAPEQTAPNVGELPQSKPFVQPSLSNQAKLSAISETFKIGVNECASMIVVLRKLGPPPFLQ